RSNRSGRYRGRARVPTGGCRGRPRHRRTAPRSRAARRRPRQRVPLPRGPTNVKTIFRLVLRTQVTRGRAAALGALGALSIILAIAVRAHNTSEHLAAATDLFRVIDTLGLAVVAPVTALVLASAALGDLAEDRTLVY